MVRTQLKLFCLGLTHSEFDVRVHETNTQPAPAPASLRPDSRCTSERDHKSDDMLACDAGLLCKASHPCCSFVRNEGCRESCYNSGEFEDEGEDDSSLSAWFHPQCLAKSQLPSSNNPNNRKWYCPDCVEEKTRILSLVKKTVKAKEKQQEPLQAGWDSYVPSEKKLQEYF
jgi:hypothetical protein